MIHRVAVLLAAVLLVAIPLRAADDENPIVTTVKSKVKDKTKPFAMSVTFKVKAGSEAAFEEAFTPCVKATRKEAGCLSYQLNRDLDDPSQFVVFEQFKSVAALELHAKTKHVEELLKKVGPLLDGEPKAKVFAIVVE